MAKMYNNEYYTSFSDEVQTELIGSKEAHASIEEIEGAIKARQSRIVQIEKMLNTKKKKLDSDNEVYLKLTKIAENLEKEVSSSGKDDPDPELMEKYQKSLMNQATAEKKVADLKLEIASLEDELEKLEDEEAEYQEKQATKKRKGVKKSHKRRPQPKRRRPEPEEVPEDPDEDIEDDLDEDPEGDHDAALEAFINACLNDEDNDSEESEDSSEPEPEPEPEPKPEPKSKATRQNATTENKNKEERNMGNNDLAFYNGIGSDAFDYDRGRGMTSSLRSWIEGTLEDDEQLAEDAILSHLTDILKKNPDLIADVKDAMIAAEEHHMPYKAVFVSKIDGAEFDDKASAEESIKNLTNSGVTTFDKVFEIKYQNGDGVYVGKDEVKAFIKQFDGDRSALRQKLYISNDNADAKSNKDKAKA